MRNGWEAETDSTNAGTKMQELKLKAWESGQTREGIGAMAVRLLRCHAFTDAPNTSVVLCSPREGGQGGGWEAGGEGGR